MGKIEEALNLLNEKLPLKGRQQQLEKELLEVHKGILSSFVEKGRPLTRKEIAGKLAGKDVDRALKRLGGDDLVVLDAEEENVVGAYPMTMQDTPHHLIVNGHKIHAMCALDSLSVSPMFGLEVAIDSRCHVTGEPIHIHQKAKEVLEVKPSPEVHVGIRWQNTCGCAASSLCMEMVFLKDRDTARKWQGEAVNDISLFTLPEAIEFGERFFAPLIQDESISE